VLVDDLNVMARQGHSLLSGGPSRAWFVLERAREEEAPGTKLLGAVARVGGVFWEDGAVRRFVVEYVQAHLKPVVDQSWDALDELAVAAVLYKAQDLDSVRAFWQHGTVHGVARGEALLRALCDHGEAGDALAPKLLTGLLRLARGCVPDLQADRSCAWAQGR